MANEFVARNGIIAKANSTISGTLDVSGNITMGTALVATRTWVTGTALTGYATESYVTTAISNLIDAAPGTLNTLNELAAALGDDPNFATTITNSIATKLPLAGGTLTGPLRIDTTGTALEITGTTTVDGSDVSIYLGNAPSAYGFYITYVGTGGGNTNAFRIQSTNAGTPKTLLISNQDGIVNFPTGLQLNGAGVATQSWVNSQSYLTSESDPVFSASPAAGITATNISNWNTAYGWGNHAGLYALASHTHSATDITSGTLASARLSGTYSINVSGSAATLTTARTLTIGNTGKTFNGSANVSWSLAEIGAQSAGSYLTTSGGTLTGTETHTTGTISYTDAILNLYNNWQSNTDEKGAIITFSDNYFDGTNYIQTTRAAIKGGTDTTGNTADGFLAFYTDSAGANTANERMRITSGGNVGIGTTSPATKLHVPDGEISTEVFSFSAINGITPVNTVYLAAPRNGNASIFTASTERLTVDASGNVGIGTTSPGEKLHVAGQVIVDGGTGVASSGTLHVRQKGNTSSDGIALTSAYGISHRIWKDVNGVLNIGPSGDPSALVQTIAGNIGIGTASPNVRLHVNEAGTVNEQTIVLGLSSTSLRPTIQFSESAGVAAGNGMSIEYDGRGSSGTNKMYINGVDNSPKLTVMSGGNVGIGTDSPTNKLDIRPTTSGGSDVIGTGAITVGSDNPYWTLRGTATSLQDLAFDRSYSGTWYEAMRIQRSTGNVGIGTTNPLEKLDVAGVVRMDTGVTEGVHYAGTGFQHWGDVGTGVDFPANDTIDISTSSTSRIRIDSAGNVGIGTTSPGAKLHVSSGSIFIDNNFSYRQKTSSGGNVGLIYIDSSNLMGIYDGKVNVTSAGNVGIGTNSPGYLLDVNGSFRTTTMTIGSGGFGAQFNSYTQHALGQLTIQSGLGGLGEGGAADHFLFRAPSLYEVTTTQGGAYSDVTSTYANTYKALFTGQKAGVTVANASIYSLRMTWDNIGYKWFDTLYIPCSFSGNTMDVTIEKYDGTNWVTVATRTGFSGWEGRNVYINPWNNSSHQQKLRITFDINWLNSNGAQFYRIAYYGGYPAGSENRLFTWDYERNTFFNAGNVGIGTTNPTGVLHVYSGGSERLLVSGDVHVQGSTDLNINGASRRFSFTNGTGTIRTTTANKLFIETNSTTAITVDASQNVGIGTTTPASRLHINTGTGTGNANTVIIDRAGSSDYSGVSFATAGTVDWSIGHNNAGNFEVFEDGQDAKTRLTIATGGNVGIGTTSPSTPLHVNVSGASDVIRFTRDTGTNGGLSLDFSGANSNFASEQGGYTFSTSSVASAAVITSAGNVGIGTTSPSTKLYIQETAASPTLLTLHNYQPDIAPGNGNFMEFLMTDGNVTATPQVKIGMVVASEDGQDSGIATEGDGNFVIMTMDAIDSSGTGTLAERVRVTHTGKVGIGTSSPTEILHVAGNIRTTGNIYLANTNIVGVNQLEINDPGEGIIWKNGASGDITLAVKDDATDNILELTGTNASLSVNGFKVATESYVTTALSNLVDSAPATLDTLNELAAALGDDPNFSTTISTALGNRLRVDTAAQGLNATQQSNGRTNLGLGTAATSSTSDFLGATATAADSNKLGGIAAASYAQLASPAFTGTPTAPTAATATNNTQIATTAFVKAQGYSTTTGTVTSVSGTGGYGGLTLSGTVTSSGNITLGGTPTGTWPISVSGNAATATSATSATSAATWTTARTLTIGNTGKSVNGSANVSWSLAEIGAASSSHNHDGVYMPIQFNTPYAILAATDWKNYGLGNGTMFQASSIGLPSGGTHGYWFNLGRRDVAEGYAGILINSYQSTGSGVWIGRNGEGTSSPTWEKVWTDLTDGSGSGLDADLLDGQQGSYYLDWTNVTNKPDPVVTLSGAVTGSATMTDFGSITIATTHTADPVLTLAGDATGSATFTNLGNATLTVTVVDDSHNHIISNVDGLQTALDGKLSLSGGTITGVIDAGSSSTAAYRFDGRSFSWNSAMQAPTSNVPHIMQQTYTGWDPVIGIKTTSGFWQHGAYSSDTLYWGYMAGAFGSHSTNGFDYAVSLSPTVMNVGSSGTMSLQVNGNTVWHTGNDGSGSSLDADLLDGQHGSYYLDSTNLTGTIPSARLSGTYSISVTGNANTATTLATSRTIALSGDVTGSASFNGGSNITITATVADDSHNHIISNVDGLQTALDGKATLAGPNNPQELAFFQSPTDITSQPELMWTGADLMIVGGLQATTKSFNIEHPTKPGKRLVYGVLEGPEHGVYTRGRTTEKTISLPEEWTGLVDEDSITVQLTAVGKPCLLYVVDIADNKVFVDADMENIEYFYYIQGTRKDIDKLEIEQ